MRTVGGIVSFAPDVARFAACAAVPDCANNATTQQTTMIDRRRIRRLGMLNPFVEPGMPGAAQHVNACEMENACRFAAFYDLRRAFSR
jgi:hypothetical protein